MHRFSSALILIASLLVASHARDAFADVAGERNQCAPYLRELDEARRTKSQALSEAESARRDSEVCGENLTSAEARATQATSAATAAQRDRDAVCGATSSLADQVIRGESSVGAEATCINPDQRSKLRTIVDGWSAVSGWLGNLAAYEAGETDFLPTPRAGSLPVERLLQRLVRRSSDGLLAYRRLLVQALNLVAPEAWQRVRSGGSASVEAWFTSKAPIDAAIVEEAQREPGGTPGASPLSAALRLVQAFQLAARCAEGSGVRECGRARQLQQMLESTGSLVVRRRIQEIWATECTAVAPETLLAWAQDFPTPHVTARVSDWAEVADAAHAKLFSCYLDDSGESRRYGSWLSAKFPDPRSLTSVQLQRLDSVKARFADGSPEETCARAVRALQTVATPSHCVMPAGDFRATLEAWTNLSNPSPSPTAQVCSQFARLLWEGRAASIAQTFPRPPSLDDMVVTDDHVPPTSMMRLRSLCDERRGDPRTFPEDIRRIATLARAFGEDPAAQPFRMEGEPLAPVERKRFDTTLGMGPWLRHLVTSASGCSALAVGEARCEECGELPVNTAYDCSLAAELDQRWSNRTKWLTVLLFGAVALGLVRAWAVRFRRGRVGFATWSRERCAYLQGLGLSARPARFRDMFPSRYDTLEVDLPQEPAWEQWGRRAAVVRSGPGQRVAEPVINHAALVALRTSASVVFLEHDDGASADLAAVRAMLEWSAKPGSRAVQILPLPASRATWSKSARDLLDLVEETSLRGNPFELRGRIASSSQFFNRERLVSGLLAAAQAGHWTVVTGLRRFGKSSLCLEVARRLPGPSAYVDLAGFDHEIRELRADVAVNAILRYVCLRLVESARARWPDADMPEPPAAGSTLDAAGLTLWFRDLSRALRAVQGGRPVTMLVILDEIEQALAVGPDRIGQALDVLAIVLGRLKNAVGDAALPDGSSPIGVFLASALHPLLWAPLRTLAHQSIMGSFPRVCVPCLSTEAASTMMRSLGARQGIRFNDSALERIIEESQGVPLLLRAMGSSVLELYDPERARQGSLGALEIGIEGATEAIEREAREGSPIRVWIETEMCPHKSVAGTLLRRLAGEERVSADALRDLAKRMIVEDFARTGIDRRLDPEETTRRAEEAASVMLHLLGETGLLEAHGDLTSPEAYALPEGAIRRVLRDQP